MTTCVDMLEKTIVKFPMTAVIDISDKAVVKFPATAFIDTPAYMSERETSERIGWYADVIQGRRANDMFRVGLRRYTKLRSIRYDTIRYDTIRYDVVGVSCRVRSRFKIRQGLLQTMLARCFTAIWSPAMTSPCALTI